MSPLEILRYYYPKDLELVRSNNIMGITQSFPGTSLRVGSTGSNVQRIQNFLNRIRVNYPLIPQITTPNGTFGTQTENAVKAFQRTFNLNPDGVIGPATWNKMTQIYVAVTKLGELNSEGVRVGIGQVPPTVTLSQGSRGEHVVQLQFILNRIAAHYSAVPPVIADGVFGASTRNSVIAFQREFGINPDGIVGSGTWSRLYAIYRGIESNTDVPSPPPELIPPIVPQYPGSPLRVGSQSENVRMMQQYLNTIRRTYTNIPLLVADGIFGPNTQNAVIAFQRQFMLTPDGIIGPVTWNKIVSEFLIASGNSGTTTNLPFPGTALRVGSRGDNVRTMQRYLQALRSVYPAIPNLTVDGVFGPITQNAVIAFQRAAGLNADGIIGPLTWNEIVRRYNALRPFPE